MIPRIAQADRTHGRYLAFLDAARAAGFRGELEHSRAQRIAAATDNSLYQILPQAVAFPRDTADVVVLARLADEPRFADIVLSARGGGTGTNGQSLTDGIVVDLSRHLTAILEIDAAARTARVQAGVVKDQLEAALEPLGLFFAPELSTSNRATIGGMVATDASGQGSVLYGKTRDHVLALRSVFLGGTVWDSGPIDDTGLAAICGREDRVGALCRAAAAELRAHAALIRERFPRLNRCLTGYDLAHLRDAAGRFDPNALLCGAEGTLAFVVEATLRLTPKPRCRALVNVGYADFDAALRHARVLMDAQPASIETVDSLVLSLAQRDVVWEGVRDAFPAGELVRGVNLVEFVADDEATLDAGIRRLGSRLDGDAGAGTVGYRIVRGEEPVRRVWAMRKRAVGLLGNVTGERRPVPFVEDTAVPPENLADYIRDFRAVLDREGLAYGMFGHVDAGVLHVRPALDMKEPDDERRVRRITDEVVALTRRYGGLLWGEHGKGVRAEYAPAYFGPLYPSLQRIKAAADPRCQLNPGKVCAPPGHEGRIAAIDAVPTRGQADRTVPPQVRNLFPDAMHCNGNGACFNFDPDDAMCPSWKATRDRVHSPKGRASLMREWLRLVATQGDAGAQALLAPRRGAFVVRAANTLRRALGRYDYSDEVRAAMLGCLSCKSCATQCPIRVDVAELRSRFLALYQTRYLRPLRAHAVCGMEAMLPLANRLPRTYNRVTGSRAGRAVLARVAGLVDGPQLAGVDLGAEMRRRGLRDADPAALAALDPAERDRAVIVVQDAFTTFFDTGVLLAVLELLRALGCLPLLAPFVANGKAMHVHGFRAEFDRVAARNAALLRRLAATGIVLVGIEPAVVLTYRQEYVALLGASQVPRVALLQEWLAGRVAGLQRPAPPGQGPFTLLAHCTERTHAADAIAGWQAVFAALGQPLRVPRLGCCGMAGTYGHEREHAATSRRIYEQSWAPVVRDPALAGRLVATGYSCRAQAKRFDGVVIPHPAETLLQLLRAAAPGGAASNA